MNPSFNPSESIRIRTPDGMLYAIIVENQDGTINHVQLSIGKAGSALSAWVHATAALITLAIQKGATVEELMNTLSNITSDRAPRTIESTCRSGPEGVWMALVKYQRNTEILMMEDEPTLRGASVGPGARIRNR